MNEHNEKKVTVCDLGDEAVRGRAASSLPGLLDLSPEGSLRDPQVMGELLLRCAVG